jgi:FAD/FMN-containing dehydrogenase
MAPPSAASIAKLGETLRGPLIGRGDARFDAARRIWNGRIDRRPLLIAQCMDVADIVACIRFARDCTLPVAVRGSGHACAGTSLCDDGLVVDLSRMKGIQPAPDRRVVRAEPDVTWGDMDHATQAFGFAVPGGTDSEIGIAGLTLAGGNGWLMGAFGATYDNVVSIDAVTADGKLLTANASQHQDLFWALRCGGNFAVATSLEYRMRPRGPRVVAGTVYHPFEQTREVLARFRDFAKAAPKPLTIYPCLIRLDDGRPVLCMAACYAGPLEDGERAVAPLRRMGEPLSDELKPMLFADWQRSMDAARPAGRPALRDALAFPRRARRWFYRREDRTLCRLPVAPLGRHCRALPWRDRACGSDRDGLCLAHQPLSFRDHRLLGRSLANLEWCERFLGATLPFSSGEVYVNSLGEGEEHRIRDAYGPNWERLRQIKRRWDPTNFFRCNQNIPPAEHDPLHVVEPQR